MRIHGYVARCGLGITRTRNQIVDPSPMTIKDILVRDALLIRMQRVSIAVKKRFIKKILVLKKIKFKIIIKYMICYNILVPYSLVLTFGFLPKINLLLKMH